jgi:hypothetical protein
VPDHCNTWGDNWNLEDLSIYSDDKRGQSITAGFDAVDIYSGGRALESLVRPYATRIMGRPIQMQFKRSTGDFLLVFETSKEDDVLYDDNQPPTIVFVPDLHYKNGCKVTVSSGDFKHKPLLYAEQCRHFEYYHDPSLSQRSKTGVAKHWIRIEDSGDETARAQSFRDRGFSDASMIGARAASKEGKCTLL